jgi:hyperosmotically inducible periplasmic protein
MMKKRTTLILAAVVGTTFGPASNDAAWGEQVEGKEQHRLETQVQQKLRSDPDLKNNKIEVKADNSVITLKGSVDTEAEKTKAASLAKVDGVARVDDQLEVGSKGAMTALSDTAVTAAVKAKLATNDRFSANQISVTTNNGVVTLEGTVASEADRQKAIDVAKSSDGVKRVADKLRIRPVVPDGGR